MVFTISLGEIIAVVFTLIISGMLFYIAARDALRQMRCKHDGGVAETNACEAICRKCGKNLGFIGNWRKRNKS